MGDVWLVIDSTCSPGTCVDIGNGLWLTADCSVSPAPTITLPHTSFYSDDNCTTAIQIFGHRGNSLECYPAIGGDYSRNSCTGDSELTAETQCDMGCNTCNNTAVLPLAARSAFSGNFVTVSPTVCDSAATVAVSMVVVAVAAVLTL